MIRCLISREGIREAVLVHNGEDAGRLLPDEDPRVVHAGIPVPDMAPDDFCYVRIVTEEGNTAWSSPFWGDGP